MDPIFEGMKRNRYAPVEYLCASRDLVHVQGDESFQNPQGYSNAVTGDAGVERKECADQRKHLASNMSFGECFTYPACVEAFHFRICLC